MTLWYRGDGMKTEYVYAMDDRLPIKYALLYGMQSQHGFHRDITSNRASTQGGRALLTHYRRSAVRVDTGAKKTFWRQSGFDHWLWFCAASLLLCGILAHAHNRPGLVPQSAQRHTLVWDTEVPWATKFRN
jgi:hypothetical protein